MRWREEAGVRWLEAELPGAAAAFTTRTGGASGPPFESLNLGVMTGDDMSDVIRNRRLAASALGIDPGAVLMARQVHGPEVRSSVDPDPERVFATGARSGVEADGQATDNPALVPLVLVADCLPIAVAGPGGVAMLHGGWRGLASGVVEHGVRAVGATAAVVGPGIGPCCYQVGEEVLEAFARLGGGLAAGGMLDLREVARRLLERAGVAAVEVSELCTACNPELFYSHRRDAGRTGRQGGFAWLAEAAG